MKLLIMLTLLTSCCGGVYLRREVVEVDSEYCDYLFCEPIVVVKPKPKPKPKPTCTTYRRCK